MAVAFVPNRITLARESRGMSQAQLAEKLGVSSQQLSEWERGQVKPGADNLAKIMTALESPATFFFVDGGANGAQGVHQSQERRTA